MEEYLYSCQRIWEGYKVYASCASVIRKGFELMGAAVVTDDALDLKSTFMRRSESILEHQAKVTWLASAFISNFPFFFGDKVAYNIPLEAWPLMIVALCHDVGESEMGDIPDDGNPLHDTKDDAELEVFKRFVSAYSFLERKDLVETFKAFQRKDLQPAQALFALDKLEAVLTHMVLESCGIYGSVKAKENPTERDSQFAKLTGSELAADIWGAQMKTRFEGFPPSITEPVYMLLQVAARDVRGKEFEWLETP